MDSYPIDYLDQSLDVPGVGQLRFNTEPEIWQARGTCSRFFSISHLFRRESELNPLRRASFIIVDFYAPGPPDALWHLFQGVLRDLTRAHLTESLLPLKLDSADYNPALDGPNLTSLTTRWVLTSGYDAAHSFFEIDETGRSTRQEIFLVTPRGHLEIGALGVAGRNFNPDYKPRVTIPTPPFHISGLGFGLERLLLADRIVASSRMHKR